MSGFLINFRLFFSIYRFHFHKGGANLRADGLFAVPLSLHSPPTMSTLTSRDKEVAGLKRQYFYDMDVGERLSPPLQSLRGFTLQNNGFALRQFPPLPNFEIFVQF